jgi:hypothetical protein
LCDSPSIGFDGALEVPDEAYCTGCCTRECDADTERHLEARTVFAQEKLGGITANQQPNCDVLTVNNLQRWDVSETVHKGDDEG